MSKFAHRLLTSTATLLLTVCVTTAAHAAGSGMPWEAPLQKILDSVQGPVAKIVAEIIIISTGLTLAPLIARAYRVHMRIYKDCGDV